MTAAEYTLAQIGFTLDGAICSAFVSACVYARVYVCVCVCVCVRVCLKLATTQSIRKHTEYIYFGSIMATDCFLLRN